MREFIQRVGLDRRFLRLTRDVVLAAVFIPAVIFGLMSFTLNVFIIAVLLGGLAAITTAFFAFIPAALIWSSIVETLLRFGINLRTSSAIAAPLVVASCCAICFVTAGSILADGPFDPDHVHFIILIGAPFAVLASPAIAWFAYRPMKASGV